MTIAALYVETDGCYFGIDGVDPWDEARDARLYAGPWPVVAHPPCQRWGKLWAGQPLHIKRTGERKIKGDDGGCFAAALAAVRQWGGVIEHPWGSHAWGHYGLITPPREGGWIAADMIGGWTCCVEQGRYGHYARKPTLLYAVGVELPELDWGVGESRLDPAIVARMGLKRAKRLGEVGGRGGGQGLADYVLTFRKPGENAAAVEGKFTQYIGTGLDVSDEAYERYARTPPADTGADWKPWPRDMWRSVLIWQRYASPVWMDINQTRTLQYRAGRDEKDEVHISPLQLDVIERCIDLWSLPGETVLTPFLGIGSEVYCAVEMGRKGVGFELKPSYFAQAVKNIAALGEARTAELFSGAA